MTTTSPSLAAELDRDAFGPLFYWPQHDRTIDAIWARAGAGPLEDVVRDGKAPGKARFVAAEVLFRKDFSFLGRVDNQQLAAIYAEALRRRYTPNANAWGLLWINDSMGEAGGRFDILEQEAIPPLVELLDDDTVVDWYEGSEAATLGNGARYRIKDFAAYYLGRMTGHRVAFHRDFAARDAEIESLRRAIVQPARDP